MLAAHTPSPAPALSARDYFVIRAIAGSEITGILTMWGTPKVTDCYGTYFDRENAPELGLMKKGGSMIPIRLLYEHGFDPDLGHTIIGMIDDIWSESDGLHFHAELDTTQRYYKRIVDEIRAAKLAISSASAEHLAEFDADGRFMTWLLSEVSLTASPCEERMIPVSIVRHTRQSDVSSSTVPHEQGDPRQGDPERTAADCNCEAEPDSKIVRSQSELTPIMLPNPTPAVPAAPPPVTPAARVTMEDLGLSADAQPQDVIAALVSSFGYDAVKAALDTLAPETAPAGEMSMNSADIENRSKTLAAKLLAHFGVTRSVGDELADVKRQLSAMQAAQLLSTTTHDTPAAPRNRQPDAAPITNMRDRRYDHTSTAGLAYAMKMMQAANVPLSGDFLRAMFYRLAQEAERGEKAATAYDVLNASPFRNTSEVMRATFNTIRANEIDNTAATAKGIEWVGTYYETDLWEVVRLAPIYQNMMSRGMLEKTIPRGYSSDIIPIEGADLTWYTVAEATTVDATNRPTVTFTLSNLGTGKATITLKKLGCAAAYSGELDEDSLIAMADELNRKIQVQGQEQIEFVMINGDTVLTASTNINLIDGTPTTQNYLVADGIMKNALLGVSGANARDGGALDKLDYRLLKTFLGTAGKAGYDVNKLLYVVDTATHDASLDIPEIATKDVSSVATIEAGVIKRIYGIDVMASGQVALANTAGKISATPGNNTKGRILCVRPDQWAVAFKREAKVEIERYALSDATVFVTSLRMGMITRDADSGSSVSYNLTV